MTEFSRAPYIIDMNCTPVNTSFILSIPNSFLALVSAIGILLYSFRAKDSVSNPHETIYEMTAYILSNTAGFK